MNVRDWLEEMGWHISVLKETCNRIANDPRLSAITKRGELNTLQRRLDALEIAIDLNAGLAHIVQEGETLWSIAERRLAVDKQGALDVSAEAARIAVLNNIRGADKIEAGVILRFREGTRLVKSPFVKLN